MDACPAIPLSGWADRQLRALAVATGSDAIARLTGSSVLGERAMLNRFCVPGQVSAGGGARLLSASDGWIALSLTRPDDRELLRALFMTTNLDVNDDGAIAERVAASSAGELVARGAELGLAIAALHESSEPTAMPVIGQYVRRPPDEGGLPLIVDLSALWAGPLATRLLKLAGATVLKVESPTRPDTMRTGDTAMFDLLNKDKASIALDLAQPNGHEQLLALIYKADIIVEASRPRALMQLGVDADAIVANRPGLIWISITGHGVQGDAANRIGFGDDCGVAGGLAAAHLRATGKPGFVGDAIADPLTGIVAARLAWDRWTQRIGGRTYISMSGVVARALAEERARDDAGFDNALRDWRAAEGRPFPLSPARASAFARPFGADTHQWLAEAQPC